MRRMLLSAVFVCTLAIFAIISVAAVSVAVAEELMHAHAWSDWEVVTLTTRCTLRDGSDGNIKFDEKRCQLDNCTATRRRNSRCE